MKLDEFYKLSKDECLERIKQESQSQAKRGLFCSLIAMLLFIVILIDIEVWNHREFGICDDIWACMDFVFCVALAWMAVNYFRLLTRVDSLDTPEELLHLYEKTIKNNRRACIPLIICIFVDPYAYDKDWIWNILCSAIAVAMIALFIFAYFKDYLEFKTRRDEEIIDRLQDIIDMR